MATPKVSYDFDKHLYMHGLCHYFAIEFYNLFGGKICLWLDKDEINDKEVLCHAFVEFAPGVCVDANGVFSTLSERFDDFEYNYVNVVPCTLAEAKTVLKRLGIKTTDATAKKNAREFLRNNLLTFDVLYEPTASYYTFGICGREDKGMVPYSSFDRVFVLNYDSKGKVFNSMVHNLHTNLFVKGIQECKGFIPSTNWYYK